MIDTKFLKENYFFHHHNAETDVEFYFCTCGKKINKKNNEAKEDEIRLEVEKNPYKDVDIMERFEGAVNVICPKCKADYSKRKNIEKIKETNSYFYGYFDFKIEDKRITLYKNKIKSSSTDKSKYVRFKELSSYVSVDSETKKLYFKDYHSKKEREFNLDELIKVLKEFYLGTDNIELSVIDKIINVHLFLSELARLVVDSENMDIIEGLMSQMIGKPGIDVLMKLNTIFFGIICYSNLSTIALTKGTVFLYDMMYNCKLPNPNILSDEGVTSPLKIFNFLVTLENEETQKEIDSEKNEDSGFVYKSKDGKRLKNLKFDLEKWGFARESNVQITEGKINVREDLKNKTVSKYIFNKIDKFEDYKKLIRFTKFISYEDLITLVMKYDIQYIIKLFNLIEFRDDINMYRLKQIIPLTLDFLRKRPQMQSSLYGTLMRDSSLSNQLELEDEVDTPTEKLDYSLLSNFSFYEYDDSVRMIEELKWDRTKEFDKLKKIEELKEYHDKLVAHYNMLSDREKNEKFIKFAEKFKYLEEYDESVKIKLLSMPTMVLDAAKEMKNCAGSYVTRISQGKYLLLMVYDKTKEKSTDEHGKFMMGLNVTQAGLEFEQFKASCNEPSSNRQKRLIMDYLEEKDISYREVRDLKITDEERGEGRSYDFEDLY